MDSRGQAFVVGNTGSDDFPTQNPFQEELRDGDAFVAKLNSAGSRLLYATYLGGSGWESGQGIALDSQGHTYVTGYTYSEDFPTRRPLQAQMRGHGDAFVAKLSPRGNALVYSTYLGGDLSEYGRGIAVDSRGQATIVGQTWSEDFPVRDSLQSAPGGGMLDAFVAKINTAGNAFIYSTYLGGRRGDTANAVDVGLRGDAYVAGETTSDDFPTKNALQPIGGRVEGMVVDQDSFITKIAEPPLRRGAAPLQRR